MTPKDTKTKTPEPTAREKMQAALDRKSAATPDYRGIGSGGGDSRDNLVGHGRDAKLGAGRGYRPGHR